MHFLPMSLYKEIGRNAIETAAVLKKGLQEKGYRFLLDSPTNQQFIILEDTRLEELRKDVQFQLLGKDRCFSYSSQICHKLGNQNGRCAETSLFVIDCKTFLFVV